MVKETKRILAVDDEPNMRRLLEISLKQAGFQPVLASNGKEALDILRKNGADLVVSDLHMPIMDGIKLLEQMRLEAIETPAIIVTAQGEIASAVAAMKLGASDYIVRPFDLETLELAIHRALSITRLKIENAYLHDNANLDNQDLIGDSPAMLLIKQAIHQVAHEKATVLITGKQAQVKEVVARAVHQQSTRKNGLFVAVNCAAIPAEMLESELFGHERGAFTGAVKARVGKFELADGGTLFLDEITEMPIALQAKLLRAIQEGVIERLGGNRPIAVDIRFLAATNRDPQQAIVEQKLREDLYYRLNVFRLDLPPLRARGLDVVKLSERFLKTRNKVLSPQVIQTLLAYAWYRNVRELENVIERASIMCSGDIIMPQHLPSDMQNKAVAGDAMALGTLPDSLSIPAAVGVIEKRLIVAALEKTKGNKSKAAKLLEISERSLWYKLTEYGLAQKADN